MGRRPGMLLEEREMSLDGYNVAEKNGAPARSRFTDPQALRAVYDKLTEDDMLEAQRRAKIRRMYDGNLPYDPRQLEACGLKNIANVNFLGLKGVIDNRSGAVLRLASDTTDLVELRPLSRELAGPDAEKIARIVAKEFSRTIREGNRVVPALSMMNEAKAGTCLMAVNRAMTMKHQAQNPPQVADWFPWSMTSVPMYMTMYRSGCQRVYWMYRSTQSLMPPG